MPEYAKRISKIRSRTAEPVLGTLINFNNMNRVNRGGTKQADKHVLIAAMTTISSNTSSPSPENQRARPKKCRQDKEKDTPAQKPFLNLKKNVSKPSIF